MGWVAHAVTDVRAGGATGEIETAPQIHNHKMRLRCV